MVKVVHTYQTQAAERPGIMEKDQNKKSVEERIRSLEDNLLRAREYLEHGSHANWHGFQPFFKKKIRNGKVAPPHRDRVENVSIPVCEKAVREAEKILDRSE